MHKKHKKSGGGKHKNKQQQQQPRDETRLQPEEIEVVPADDEKTDQAAYEEEDKGRDENEEVIDGPVEIRHSDVMGRYLVASRDLKPGDWILSNIEPLVVGPCQGGSPALCVGCHSQLGLPLRLEAHCPECGLPMCGPRCPGTYHAPECQILRKSSAAPFAPDLLDLQPGLYNTIVPLRCLALRDTQPKKWQVLMRMEAHNKVRKARPNIWEANQKLVVDPIRTLWGLGDLFSEDEVHTVCGILEVNAFEVGPQGVSVRALYPWAYIMAHDCTPNTGHSDDAHRRLSVRAGVKINKGESVTLSYAYTLQGTLRRRQHMREGKFFDCVCHRCSDKTELGTFCSAFKCPKCGASRVLSSDPLDDHAPWECVTCGNYSATASAVDSLLKRLGDEAEAIESNDVVAFEKFLVTYEKLLPPCHYLMLGVKHSLCQLYGKVEGYLIPDLSDELIKRKRDICEELMPIFDVLEPGMSRLRGITLYELHAPIMVLATRSFETRNMSRKDLQFQMKKVAECLQQAAEILRLDPEGSSERQMADAAAQALLQVNNWRKQIAGK